jgi:hypothetical protein
MPPRAWASRTGNLKALLHNRACRLLQEGCRLRICSDTQIDVILNVKHVVKGLANRGLEVRHDQMDSHGTQQTLD